MKNAEIISRLCDSANLLCDGRKTRTDCADFLLATARRINSEMPEDSADQSRLLTVHHSDASTFWLGVVTGFTAATLLFAVVIAGILKTP